MHKFNPEFADRLLADERTARLPADEIVDRLPLSPSQEIADVGCGPGYFTIPLAERVPGGTVYALDTEEAMLDRCRLRVAEAGLSNVHVAQSSETSLPLDPASMDGIFLAFVLHQATEDRVAFLQLLARYTRPGGWLAILEWRRIETPFGPPQQIRIEPDELTQLIGASDWIVEEGPDLFDDWYYYTLARRRT